jgi:hypothetical protein
MSFVWAPRHSPGRSSPVGRRLCLPRPRTSRPNKPDSGDCSDRAILPRQPLMVCLLLTHPPLNCVRGQLQSGPWQAADGGAFTCAGEDLSLSCALAGLGLFVPLVGSDASVHKGWMLMSAVTVASFARRGLSLLSLNVTALLLGPELGVSFGFLLSFRATLRFIVLGRSRRIHVRLPTPDLGTPFPCPCSSQRPLPTRS